ncbi:MAG: hypothetical protein JSS99_07385 [Actinobacteria bacterium]|nr:hypothetical protein [Actinomycetota bacterium]
MPLRALERRGHQVLWPDQHDSQELLMSAVPAFDVFVIHHYFDEWLHVPAMRLREAGVAVIWDKDDDISANRRGSVAFRSYGGRRGMRRAFARSAELARASSLMTTPSEHLAQRYRDEGVEFVEVIENYLAPEQLKPQRQRHPGVVIGITAAREHQHDIAKLRIDKVLQRVLEAHDGVRVMSFGCALDLPPGRYANESHVPIEQLVAREQQFDIGLAPLVDSAFNRARSNVKLKEYAAAGAMWLASPIGPYVGMGEAQGGMLVDDHAWQQVLEELIVDYRRRVELMKRARAWAPSQSIEHAAGSWEAAFVGALRRAQMG